MEPSYQSTRTHLADKQALLTVLLSLMLIITSAFVSPTQWKKSPPGLFSTPPNLTDRVGLGSFHNEPTLFNYATQLLQKASDAEALAEALRVFEIAAEMNPSRDATWFNIAMLKEENEDIEGALKAYSRAISCTDNAAVAVAAYNNKVGLLLDLDRLEEAAKASDEAVNAHPNDPTAWISMAVVLRINGNLDWAKTCFENAIARSTDDDSKVVVALNNLGAIYSSEGRLAESISMYRRAVTVQPSDVSSLVGLASALADAGQRQEALRFLKSAQAVDPTDSQISFQITLLEGAAHSSVNLSNANTIPREYVSDLFDFYAQNSYEKHMIDTLQYRGPELLWGAFVNATKKSKSEMAELKVVELGVGSGLCGAYFRKQGIGSDLIGCDLSSIMVQKASRESLLSHDCEELVYRSVVVSDCLDFLNAHGQGEADVVLAGDVLCYIGDLEPLLNASHAALKPDGVSLFLFTVEELLPSPDDDDDVDDEKKFVLQSSGRFAHSSKYIQELASRSGFSISSMSRETVRVDGDVPVPALIVVLRLQ